MKLCNRCGVIKEESHFYARSDRIGVLRPQCKQCEGERFKQYRSQNPDKFKAYQSRRPRRDRAKYRAKQAKDLADYYVAGLLKLPLNKVPPEFLKLKREQIQLLRLTRELNEAVKQQGEANGIGPDSNHDVRRSS